MIFTICFWIGMAILVILLIASLPVFPHSRKWGYVPVGGVLLVIVVALLLWFLLFLPLWFGAPQEPVGAPQ